jgi:acetyl esterase/lipase
MTSPSFHPELRTVARFLPRQPISTRSLRYVRWGDVAMSRRPAPEGSTIDRADDVPLRVHRPTGFSRASVDSPGPAVLWIHGGGYVMGTAAQDDAGSRQLADTLGAVVASVDYRLAPEHPHPGPIEDCYHALLWLAAQPDVDPARIAIAGASAGGGLAAALTAYAVDRGEVAPAFQLLVYPMLDDRTVLAKPEVDPRWFRLWTPASNRFGWTSYLAAEPGTADVPLEAVPSRREDLSALPPAWIGVGTLDLFHREDVTYAERLRAAGVPCELQVVPGAFHGFDMVQRAQVVRDFRDSQLAALAAALGTS